MRGNSYDYGTKNQSQRIITYNISEAINDR